MPNEHKQEGGDEEGRSLNVRIDKSPIEKKL